MYTSFLTIYSLQIYSLLIILSNEEIIDYDISSITDLIFYYKLNRIRTIMIRLL